MRQDHRLSGHIHRCTCVANLQKCVIFCQVIDLCSLAQFLDPSYRVAWLRISLMPQQFSDVSVAFRFLGARGRRARKSKSYSTETGFNTVLRISKSAYLGVNCDVCRTIVWLDQTIGVICDLITFRLLLLTCQVCRSIVSRLVPFGHAGHVGVCNG